MFAPIRSVAVVLLVAASMVVAACGSTETMKKGTAGLGVGAVVGGVIGAATGNTARGAIIGAAIGGTAGVLIGKKMDQQAEEMQQDLANARVERVGEGIKITFDSGILFAVDSAILSAEARDNIRELAIILNKYPDTNIVIEGDTDSTGTEEHNQDLSERRASAVAEFHVTLGVVASRISTVGLGETNPIASNETLDGRKQNRRVEVAIFANEKMKAAAQGGTLN